MAVRYSDEELAVAIRASVNYSETLRNLGNHNPSGGSIAHLRGRIARTNLDISHFTFRAREVDGGHSNLRYDADAVFIQGVRRRREQLLRALIDIGVPYKCLLCSNPGEWQGLPLPLEIDHIDGDRLNNLRTNLRLLCPNCHAQQETGTSARTSNLASFVIDSQGRARLTKNRESRIAKQLARRQSLTTKLTCPVCSGPKDHRANKCLTCRNQSPRKKKIKWPPDGELVTLLQSKSYLEVANMLGVSDNAIRKHLRSRSIQPPKKHNN